jgi:hypothetical protein
LPRHTERIIGADICRQENAMRSAVVAVLAVMPLLGYPAHAGELPYDPYPWCAVYSSMDGAANCGFLTLQQCRLTIGNAGGFCERNSLYNPRGAAARHRRR